MRDKYKRDEDCRHRPKLHNEMVHNQDEPLSRAKRSPKRLSSTWGSDRIFFAKTKKDYTKQKHRPGGRGKKHSVELGYDWKTVWELEKYCQKHDVPYKVEKKCKSYTKTRKHTAKWKPVYSLPNYVTKRVNGEYVRVRSGERWVYDYVECEPYYTSYRCREILGYTFVWWSDKDIGIQYILKGKD